MIEEAVNGVFEAPGPSRGLLYDLSNEQVG